MSVRDQLRIAREEADLTQGQVAEAIGVDQSHVSNVEKDKKGIPLSRIERWAEFLGLRLVLAPRAAALPEEMATLPSEQLELLLRLARTMPAMSEDARALLADQVESWQRRYLSASATSQESRAKLS